MDLRTRLYEWASEHRLDAAAWRRLETLAGIGSEPVALRRRLPLGIAVLAAALLGLALIFWIAANWGTFGRFGRFAVLQSALACTALAALVLPAWRAPLALAMLLATGALFAFFGQTYQTGADPWQLFALWAALALPLALAVRSDIVWAPWALVAMTAVSLWVHAQIGHRWHVDPADLGVHLLGWAAALAVVLALSAPARAITGAGDWALRTAVTLAVLGVTLTALATLFGEFARAPYALALAALAAAAAVFTLRGAFDVFALSAVALGLNVLVVAGVGRWMFAGARGDAIGRLMLLGLLAAAALAASISAILRLARARTAGQ